MTTNTLNRALELSELISNALTMIDSLEAPGFVSDETDTSYDFKILKSRSSLWRVPEYRDIDRMLIPIVLERMKSMLAKWRVELEVL